MYSIVLMAALTASGPEAAAFCDGCGAAWSQANYGRPYESGVIGNGGAYGLHGCYGVVAYGQYGGCAGHRYTSCFGLYGGTACYGGCYGSCLGNWAHYAGCYGGCYGQPIWYGPQVPYHPSGNPMVAPGEKLPDPKTPAEIKPMGAAKLIFDLPTGANLFVEDQPIKGHSATRQFSTPQLVPGQAYYYTVRVEATRDGKPVSESRRVIVRAGEMIRESFFDAKSEAMVQTPR